MALGVLFIALLCGLLRVADMERSNNHQLALADETLQIAVAPMSKLLVLRAELEQGFSC